MKEIIDQMMKKGYKFEKGLSDEDIKIIEKRYNIKFPKSLIEFYKLANPISGDFVNWKDDSEENITKNKKLLNAPIDDILFEIEQNNYWVSEWEEPETIDEKKKKFVEIMKNEPKLIPFFYTRYVVSKEGVDDPGVLSLWGGDVIVLGNNLLDYLDNEIHEKMIHESYYSDYMGKWIDIMNNYLPKKIK